MNTNELEQIATLQETIQLAQKQIDELSKPRFEYPLYFKFSKTGIIVKFTSLTNRETIANPNNSMLADGKIGFTTNTSAHTEERYWLPVMYSKERGLYDKQPVLMWNCTSLPFIRFYDAISDCVFLLNGSRNGSQNGSRYSMRPIDNIPTQIQDWANAYLED